MTRRAILQGATALSASALSSGFGLGQTANFVPETFN